METISLKTFLLPIRICKYYSCGKEFQPLRKDKLFCCRECKNSNRKMKKYYKNKQREE